jgi:autotransporter-associated beta strand protein
VTGGLTINGGGITLLDSTGANTFSAMGTYNLIGYVGSLAGGDVSNLAVVNKVVGKRYTFGTDAGFVTLAIGEAGYWNGGSTAPVSTNWSDANNWNGIAPGSNDTLVFATAGAGGTTLNNNIGGGPFASLLFESGAPAFRLNGNSITLNGDGLDKVIIVNNSTAKQTVNLDITLGNNGKINAGAVSVTAAASSGDTISNGDITGTSYNISNNSGEAVISANLLANGSAGLTKSGAGTATLSGNNTYTGLTNVAKGTLKLGSAGALGGKGGVTVDGTLDLNGNSPTINAFNGAGTVINGGTAASVLTVSSGTLTGLIVDGSGTVALVKTGSGTLQFGAFTLPSPWEPGSDYYTNSITSLTVNEGMVIYCDTDAFGTATVTLAGGTSFKGWGSAEGRYLENKEDLANDFVLSGGPENGGLVNLPLGHGESKDIWFKGVVSGPGGFRMTGTHRTVTLSNNNTFEGGVTLQCGDCCPNALQIASYTALGTGTLTVDQQVHTGASGGLLAGENLDGTVADKNGVISPSGVTNNIVIRAGRYFNVSGSDAAKGLLLSGEISGGGTLRKHRNDSTVTLSGAIAHTGGTIVNSGTLTVNGTLDHSNVLIDTEVWKQWVDGVQVDVSYPPILNGSGTLTFNIEGATCDLIKVMNGGTLDITNLHIDVDAADLTELSYVLVDWAIEAGEGEPAILPGNLIGAKFAGASVPYGWKIDYDLVEKQILLVPGVVGDTNLDGVVDAADFMTLKRNFGAGFGGGATVGNFDNTGTVDWTDLSTLMTNMGAGGAAPATTPEPATLGLLMFGAAAIIRRRRRA